MERGYGHDKSPSAWGVLGVCCCFCSNGNARMSWFGTNCTETKPYRSPQHALNSMNRSASPFLPHRSSFHTQKDHDRVRKGRATNLATIIDLRTSVVELLQPACFSSCLFLMRRGLSDTNAGSFPAHKGGSIPKGKKLFPLPQG
uniref:Uncharacterized protein n=1 Tax=Entomoneis paludosa TaxID=265537 RepID=A0A7S2YFQ4_9STRA